MENKIKKLPLNAIIRENKAKYINASHLYHLLVMDVQFGRIKRKFYVKVSSCNKNWNLMLPVTFLFVVNAD